MILDSGKTQVFRTRSTTEFESVVILDSGKTVAIEQNGAEWV